MISNFNITGMSCSACSAHIEKAVKKLDGINKVNVNLLTNSMTVDFEDKILNVENIINAVKNAGYGATLNDKQKKHNDKNVLHDTEIENMKFKIYVSFFFLAFLMYVSMGHMIGLKLPSFLSGAQNSSNFALTQLLLTIPIIFVNKKYYINGFKAFLNKSPSMDTLIAIGSGSALLYSIFSLYQIGNALGQSDFSKAQHYMHDLYFEAAAMILTLVSLGKFLETKAKKQTSDAISKLIDLRPKTANIIRDGKEIIVDIDDVVVDDIVVVRAGQSVPVDGIIISGNAVLDESALTGESMPVDKGIGENVLSASISKSGYFTLKALKVGENTTLSQMIKLVENASSSKAPMAQLADKVSGVFVPIIILISFITFISWLFISRDISISLSNAITVLVISCPCSLGLATPVAIMVGTGVGAKNGILFKSAYALEKLGKVNTILLDKTGTITEGKPDVTDVITLNGFEENELLKIAVSLEKPSHHPIAHAIVNNLDCEIIYQVENFESVHGFGVCAKINGEKYIAGNKKLIEKHNIFDENAFSQGSNFAQQGKTPVYFAKNNKLIGIISICDTIKNDSVVAIEQFKNLGISVTMLTGDNEKTAKAVAQKVNIQNFVCDAIPQVKESTIKNLIENGKTTAMIGDGINDAPALARSDVGIAIGAGTDIAIESADIVLMKSSLTDAVKALELSKYVVKNIKQNIFWAFIYNLIGIPLAAGIFYPNLKLTPMFGSFAMSMSSLCVVLNALRLKNINFNTQNKKNLEELKMQKTIKIEGMMCPHCSSHVKKALENFENIQSADVSHETGLAKINISSEISDDTIRNIINEAGYSVLEIS